MLFRSPDEDSRAASTAVAQALRARGIAAEVAASAQKYGRQIRYAERRGIPFVWFSSVAEDGSPTHEVKDIRSGEQVAADPASWQPPAEDLHATVLRAATTDD